MDYRNSILRTCWCATKLSGHMELKMLVNNHDGMETRKMPSCFSACGLRLPSYFFLLMPLTSTQQREMAKAAGYAAGGALVGAGTIAATGWTAIGILGTGTSIGSAAGPVGAAIGAISGLAVYGIYRACQKKK